MGHCILNFSRLYIHIRVYNIICVYIQEKEMPKLGVSRHVSRARIPQILQIAFLERRFLFYKFFPQSTMSHNSNKIKKMVNYPCNA